MSSAEQACLSLMANLEKPKLVKMPAWKSVEPRLSQNAIIAFEVYGRPGSVFSERDVVLALNSLVENGFCRRRWARGTLWFERLEEKKKLH